MLSLCIAASALLAGQACALNPVAPLLPTQCGDHPAIKVNAQDYYASTLKRLGIVVAGNWERPRRACSEKLAHLPVPRPLNQTVAPQPLALMPAAGLTLARGMTFKKLLRRRSIG
ncbi:hypothetical protein BFW87_05375 [Pseudomonas fluorescens]|uniref:Lipoprotein n=2 Tax=Pseudomonas fluorescens TaxID=294 RepID=A0A1T2Z1U8_PSEFL|nr:hypothetical protein BFW87_05375 [Pseudomonas fluorescens]